MLRTKRVSDKEKQGGGADSYSAALETPDEGIRGARRPHAVELGRVPDGLVGQLRHADGVGSRARGRVGEAVAGDGVVHVRLVVWAVEVLAVPAAKNCLSVRERILTTYFILIIDNSRGEMMDSENAGRAWLVREVNHLGASVEQRGEAVESQADVALGLVQGACGR